MNKKQKKLLLQAAIALVEKKPPLNMEYYRSTGNGNHTHPVKQLQEKHPCGTSGCFLGWCPFLGIPGLWLSKKDYADSAYDFGGYSFDRYCSRVFGISDENPKDAKVWDWLFGPLWSNRRDSVLKRVKYYVVHGKAPDWYNELPPEDVYDDFSWKAPTLDEAKEAVGVV